MKSWMVDIAKKILLDKQDAHVTTYMIHLQSKIDQACKNDSSHTSLLAEG